MKYVIIIPDGAADEALDELGGKTPLQAANTPAMDWIAANGKCGTVCNIPESLPCGSDVALLSVFGYDPTECYTGRAPLEAAAQGLEIADDEVVFRCNLVTIVDGIMVDNTAGHISTEEAAAIIDQINRTIGGEGVRFFGGVGYRHLMICKIEGDVRTVPPHDILGQPVKGSLPSGRSAAPLRELIERSQELLVGNEINVVRRDLGENPATSIWLWGEGKMPTLKPFLDRFELEGAAIMAVDLVRGLSKLIGWEVIEVEGATGYVDTNYAGKGAAAIAALDRFDIVTVHIEAPDEAGHNANPKAKVHAIEQIDKHIVTPVLERLRLEGDRWRILVLPDHPTPCKVRTHTYDPVPFAIAGRQIESLVHEPFSEETARASGLHVPLGHELMEYFLTVR